MSSSGKQNLTYGMGNRGPNSSVAEYHVGKGWENQGLKYKKNTMKKEDCREEKGRGTREMAELTLSLVVRSPGAIVHSRNTLSGQESACRVQSEKEEEKRGT